MIILRDWVRGKYVNNLNHHWDYLSAFPAVVEDEEEQPLGLPHAHPCSLSPLQQPFVFTHQRGVFHNSAYLAAHLHKLSLRQISPVLKWTQDEVDLLGYGYFSGLLVGVVLVPGEYAPLIDLTLHKLGIAEETVHEGEEEVS